jgi:hypothetical protein
MKMHFQVMMIRQKRKHCQQDKLKTSQGWKHVAVIECITAEAARKEETMFFSLFQRNYRRQ